MLNKIFILIHFLALVGMSLVHAQALIYDLSSDIVKYDYSVLMRVNTVGIYILIMTSLYFFRKFYRIKADNP